MDYMSKIPEFKPLCDVFYDEIAMDTPDIGFIEFIINKFSAKDIENITEIHLDFKGINTIPYNIGKLKNLKYLYLDRNNISSIPDSFYNLDKLQQLSLCGNNVTNPLTERKYNEKLNKYFERNKN